MPVHGAARPFVRARPDQLAVEVGAPKIADVAHRMGIRSPLNENSPAIVLGASAVSPLEMAAAYSTIANYGQRVDNYLIASIADAKVE